MTALGARLDRWLLVPMPAERLAVFRVLVGTFVTIYLLIRLPAFLDLAHRRPSTFAPVGALAWLDRPLPATAVHVLIGTALVGAVAFTVGVGHRLLAPGFALALVLLTTYRSSWSQLLHFENLPVLHVLILAFSPAVAAVSIDSLRSRRTPPGPDTCFGWPLRLATLVTVTTYLIAGFAKIRYGGFGWLDGDTLRNHIAYTAARLDVFGETPSPIVEPLVGLGWLFTPLAVMGMSIELVAPVALFGSRLRNFWVTAAIAMHAFIAAAMFIVFPYPLFGVAFAPMFKLEQLLPGFRSG